MSERVDKRIQREMKESAYKIWLAGLGAVSVAEEEGSKFFKGLVEKGENFQGRSGKNVEAVKGAVGSAKGRAEDMFEKFENMINDRITSTLSRLGVPSREEIKDLNKRVEALMEAIEKLSEAQESGKKEAAKK